MPRRGRHRTLGDVPRRPYALVGAAGVDNRNVDEQEDVL